MASRCLGHIRSELIWAFMIVRLHPFGGHSLYVLQIVSVILGQPLVSNYPVKALDVRILLWLAGLDVFQRDLACAHPFADDCTQVFRGVVTANRQGLSSPTDDLLTRSEGSEKSSSMPSASRLKSSITLSPGYYVRQQAGHA